MLHIRGSLTALRRRRMVLLLLIIVGAILWARLPAARAVPVITATKTDSLLVDEDNDGQADPGDSLAYTIVVQNSGTTDATGVFFSDTIDALTTLVPGSIRTSPVARNDAYDVLGNVPLAVPAGSGVLANDNDPDGTGGVTVISADSASAAGGAVAVAGDGSFTYLPPVGFSGVDSFDYRVADGDTLQDDATVTLTVSHMVWFIDNSGGAGDGRLDSPFNSIAAFNAVQTGVAPGARDGDVVFLHSGSGGYGHGIQLRNGQRLLGQGANLAAQLSLLGITVPPFSAPLPGTAGRPVIAPASGNGIRLAADNLVRGLNVGSTPGGSGLVDNGGVGTLTIDGVAISGSGGGVSLVNGGTLAVALDGLSASSSSDEGIHLVGVGGSFSVSGAGNTISASNVPAVYIDGASLALDITLQSVSASAAAVGILVQDTSGSFVVTGSGATDGSGGIISNIVSRGASFINSANIALTNMTFNNAATTDAGSNCDALVNSGCHAAVHLDDVSNVNLTNVDITNSVQQGINGLDVAGFALSGSSVTQCGNGVNEGCLRLVNLSGTATISNSDLAFAAERVAQIANNGVTLALTVTNSTFRDTQSSGLGADGLEISSDGAAVTAIDIVDSGFLRHRTNGLQVFAQGTAFVTVDVTGSTFDRGTGIGIGLDLAADDAATLHFNVVGNPLINSSGGNAVNVFADQNATVQGRINSNPDIQAGGPTASGFGIAAQANGSSDVTLDISGNNISNIGFDAGIRVLSRGGSGRLDATINNNDVSVNATNSLYDIWVQAQDNNTTCANVTSNSASAVAIAAFRARTVDAGATVILEGSGSTAAAVWSGNGNTPAAGPVSSNHNGTLTLGGVCDTVTHPTAAAAASGRRRHPGGPAPSAVRQPRRAAAPAGSTAGSAAAPASGETVGVALGTMNPGQAITITFSVVVDTPFAAGLLQACNQGTLSGDNFTGVLTDDPDTVAAGDPTCTAVDAAPDLVLDKDDGGVSIQPGGVLTYTLTYSNTGNQHATGVIITDTVPAHTTFNAGASTAGWACVPNAGAGSLCTLAVGPVSVGAAAAVVAFAVDVVDPVPSGVTQLSNQAAIGDDGSGGPDPDTANNQAGDATPVVDNLFTLGDVDRAEGDAGVTAFTFTISRTNTALTATVQAQTADGTAGAGTDYAALGPVTLEFPAGGPPTRTVTVEVTGDVLFEADETFVVTLLNPTNGAIGDGTGTGTIRNDDALPEISIQDVAVGEGAGAAVFAVTLSAASGLDTMVDYRTADDTAVAPGDYAAVPTTTLTIPAGATAGPISVTISDDVLFEGTEQFWLVLSDPVNAILADGQGVGRILDDDGRLIFLPLIHRPP